MRLQDRIAIVTGGNLGIGRTPDPTLVIRVCRPSDK